MLWTRPKGISSANWLDKEDGLLLIVQEIKIWSYYEKIYARTTIKHE